nr:GTP-binding protein [Comamonas serinivorans]
MTASQAPDTGTALRFITCGSVDDGKSTLIGRLLVDSRAVLQDHLAGVTKQTHDGDQVDLARLTDGLAAEREQGITIDVAWRYFSTEARKFIIGDAPGHEQYTRNMVTAASQADAAVVLVDATKLPWAREGGPAQDSDALLPQTRRHSLLAHLLRVPSIVFAVNKLDALPDAAGAFARISAALTRFTQEAGIQAVATVPMSALKGWNVVGPRADEPGWAGYQGPALLELLETLPVTGEAQASLAFPVQWVETPQSGDSDTARGRRVLWGRVAAGELTAGSQVQVLPSGQRAVVAEVINHVRQPGAVLAGHSAGLKLDRELDISRGDWVIAAPAPVADDSFDEPTPSYAVTRELQAVVAWLDDDALTPGRVYWALHGHRWIKARVKRVVHQLNINTLAREESHDLPANAIGRVELTLQDGIPAVPYAESRHLGALILVDSATNRTAAAVLVA